MAPYVLTYLRYTLFIVLYPIGVTGEIMSIIRFVNLRTIKQQTTAKPDVEQMLGLDGIILYEKKNLHIF